MDSQSITIPLQLDLAIERFCTAIQAPPSSAHRISFVMTVILCGCGAIAFETYVAPLMPLHFLEAPKWLVPATVATSLFLLGRWTLWRAVDERERFARQLVKELQGANLSERIPAQIRLINKVGKGEHHAAARRHLNRAGLKPQW